MFEKIDVRDMTLRTIFNATDVVEKIDACNMTFENHFWHNRMLQRYIDVCNNIFNTKSLHKFESRSKLTERVWDWISKRVTP